MNTPLRINDWIAGRGSKDYQKDRFPQSRIDAVMLFRHTAAVFMYSKLAQGGIAAVSFLASASSEDRLVGSAEIAGAREMSRQLIAKILTKLSQAGLVIGTPGPTGGYRLSRPASQITLLDVVSVFEDLESRVMCPFGPNWCGHGRHCPLHDKFIGMHDEIIANLRKETFAQFVGVH